MSIKLPVSKTDIKAMGSARACDCPYHAVAAQLQNLKGEFGDPLPEGLPLFPTAEGLHASTEAVVVQLCEAIESPRWGWSCSRLSSWHAGPAR